MYDVALVCCDRSAILSMVVVEFIGFCAQNATIQSKREGIDYNFFWYIILFLFITPSFINLFND